MSAISSDLLQSHGWEQFQRALGRRTWRVDGVLMIAMPLPLGLTYLYAPRGSFFHSSSRPSESASKWRDLVCAIERLAHETGAIFLRGEFIESQIPNFQFRPTPPRILRRAVEPEWTWRVSLVSDDHAMLAAMHPKHRYNIRVAERDGVVIRRMSNDECRMTNADMGACWNLLHETAQRQGIATHPRRYYEMMLATLPQTALYLAEREGVSCAAAIVAHHGDTATYLHGGSSHAQRQHMAPHLLHWHAMRDAKRAGMRWYDFGGVSPQAAASSSQLPASSWEGITRFKQGFGGEAIHHPPMMDLVFRRGWYTLLAMVTRMRPISPPPTGRGS